MSKKMRHSPPCSSCKQLRRRCSKDCIFAPFFPPDEPQKFSIVHKVFGASNVSKMLQELPVHQRADAVSSMVYEANARIRDPVYGCVGTIAFLQKQLAQVQIQLAEIQAELLSIQMQQSTTHIPSNQDENSLPLSDNFSFNSNIDFSESQGFASSSFLIQEYPHNLKSSWR